MILTFYEEHTIIMKNISLIMKFVLLLFFWIHEVCIIVNYKSVCLMLSYCYSIKVECESYGWRGCQPWPQILQSKYKVYILYEKLEKSQNSLKFENYGSTTHDFTYLTKYIRNSYEKQIFTNYIMWTFSINFLKNSFQFL